MVDAMGAFSPIAAQSREGAKPDSVVLMVGSCAEGLPPCTHADLLFSFTPIDRSSPSFGVALGFRVWDSTFALSLGIKASIVTM